MSNKRKLAIMRLLNLAAVDMITDSTFWSSVGNALTDTINRTSSKPAQPPITNANRLLAYNVHRKP